MPTVVLPVRHEARHDHTGYYTGVLQLVLDKTREDFGPCELRIHDDIIPQTRRYMYLAQDLGIDVVDATSSDERKERFRTIPIPILKGLMGYRVSFIRAKDEAAFRAIDSIEALGEFQAGQGTTWPDVDTLRHNGLPVVTAHNYASLFRMLLAQRFDYFPRGAHEILDEIANFDTEGLMPEPSFILAYPSPVYFHVRRDNVALAERIKTGLQRAIADGSFDEHFYNHEIIVNTFEQLQLDKRKVFFLCNPAYRESPWLDDDRYWIHPWPKDLCATAPKQGLLTRDSG
ncbi:type 2 periplasmic-binding domain-containing protein [Marinimicrobium alkaliphilum]|uniref:hypothetical protein n=1 Tax=Marinimicrobium alkaliphilum TaxID=2202654 RepID=UPI000DBA825F|nr:hypothetical protein [Marinimicrobium alkaliphilum]